MPWRWLVVCTHLVHRPDEADVATRGAAPAVDSTIT